MSADHSKGTTLYLVDASIYIFRAYFSLPERWPSPQGYPQNAVYGYTSFLLDFIQDLGARQSHCVAATFDESLGSCYRNRIYPDYKVSRELPDEALAYQLDACRRVTELMGIACFAGSEYEADDYIATLARLGRERGQGVTVVSRDKDLGQILLSEHDRLWDYAGGSRMDRGQFCEKFGVWPEQFADYQGLVGDSIDDIPGVPAVGAKTGARLIQAFGSLEALEEQRDELTDLSIRGAAKISKNLHSHWQSAIISRQLARLADTIEGIELPAPFRLTQTAAAALLEYLEQIQLTGGVIYRLRSLQSSLED